MSSPCTTSQSPLSLCQKVHGEVDPRRNPMDSSIRAYSCYQHLAASLVPYSTLRKRPHHPGCSISTGSSTFLSLRITGASEMSTNRSFRGSHPLDTVCRHVRY